MRLLRNGVCVMEINPLSNVTDLQAVRLERQLDSGVNSAPEYDIFNTRQNSLTARCAGMVVRAVVTEPVDTDVHDNRPAIIIKHGFMASRPAYDEYAQHLASSGRRVVHYGMPRSSSKGRAYHPKNLVDTLRMHSQALNGVTNTLREIYKDSPDKYVYIGHSMGGLATSKFIDHRPDAIESAILLGSAGLTPHSFKQMTGRALRAVPDEIIPFVRDTTFKKQARLAVHSAWHVGRNPLLLLREGYQAATGNALPYIDRARQAGVPVGAIWMTEDTFFPEHEIDSQLQSHFDETMFTWHNHLKPQDFPMQAAHDALEMIDRLNRRSRQPAQSRPQETIA